MKRFLVACNLVFLVIWIQAPLFAQQTASSDKIAEVDTKTAPKLVIKEVTHDVGEVIRGDRVTHAFVVRNEGKGNLLIDKVSPG